MTSELVERLRDNRHMTQCDGLAAVLRTGIEAAAEIERLTARAEARQAERAAVDCSVKLWALLDDIDTLDDVCRSHDDLFRTLTRAAQQKRHAIMSGEEWDAARQTGEPA